MDGDPLSHHCLPVAVQTGVPAHGRDGSEHHQTDGQAEQADDTADGGQPAEHQIQRLTAENRRREWWCDGSTKEGRKRQKEVQDKTNGWHDNQTYSVLSVGE